MNIVLNRIRAEDFKTLEEHIGERIQIADSVSLQSSRTERFMEVFRDQVSQNPVYRGYPAAEVCFISFCYSPTIYRLVKQMYIFPSSHRTKII